MNTERDNKLNTNVVGLNARSTTIIVVAILFAGALGGILAGRFVNPGLFFDMDKANCQKKCEVANPGSDADSISKKLNCQLIC